MENAWEINVAGDMMVGRRWKHSECPSKIQACMSRVKVLDRQREAHIAESMLSRFGAASLAIRTIWKRHDAMVMTWHSRSAGPSMNRNAAACGLLVTLRMAQAVYFALPTRMEPWE
jgi:hypothetical protein